MELFLLFFGAFSTVIVLFLAYLGYFNTVRFKVTKLPKLTLALMPFEGSYKESTALQVELFKRMQEAGLTSDRSCGIYFDDPKKVASNRLRSLVGMVVAEHEKESFLALQTQAKLIELEEDEAIVSSFAYKSGLSILLAISKIYPAFDKYAKRNGLEKFQSIEVYDFSKKKLYFYFPKESKEKLWDALKN